MGLKKITIKAADVTQVSLIRNKGSSFRTISDRSMETREKSAQPLSAASIDGNISHVRLGGNRNPAVGTFQRVDPKYNLVTGLGWKQTRPSYHRFVIMMAGCIILALLLLGYRLQKEIVIPLKKTNVRHGETRQAPQETGMRNQSPAASHGRPEDSARGERSGSDEKDDVIPEK